MPDASDVAACLRRVLEALHRAFDRLDQATPITADSAIVAADAVVAAECSAAAQWLEKNGEAEAAKVVVRLASTYAAWINAHEPPGYRPGGDLSAAVARSELVIADAWRPLEEARVAIDERTARNEKRGV